MEMQMLIVLVVMAFLGEAIWETVKMFKKDRGVSWDRVGAFIICLVLAFGGGLDIFALLGIALTFGGIFPPIIGSILGMFFTGLLISRGTNFVHDLLGTVSSIFQNNKV